MYTVVLQEILVDRAVHAAASRFVQPIHVSNSTRPTLVMEDFSKAMHGFLPVAMRDLRKYAPNDKDGGWEDVGGLNEAVTIIKEVHISYFLVLRTLVSYIHSWKSKHVSGIFHSVLCAEIPTYVCVPSCRLLNCHRNIQTFLPGHLFGCDQTFSSMDHLDAAKLTL
jgi:hypothetical protein